MNADKDRLKLLLTEMIRQLCQGALTFNRELHVQGLLGITVDDEVFLIPVDEKTSSWKQSSFMGREVLTSTPCDSMPQQTDPAVCQLTTSEFVGGSVSDGFLNTASSRTLPSWYHPAENGSGMMDVAKTEISNANDNCGRENEIGLLGDGQNGSVLLSESGRQPVLPEHTFSTAARFRSSAAVAQAHRVSVAFGNDVVVYNDNNDWTNFRQREINVPVAGYSQWTNYGEEIQDNLTVSIYNRN